MSAFEKQVSAQRKQDKPGRYSVKCDDCSKTIRRTDNVRESYEGGVCEDCDKKRKEAIR